MPHAEYLGQDEETYGFLSGMSHAYQDDVPLPIGPMTTGPGSFQEEAEPGFWGSVGGFIGDVAGYIYDDAAESLGNIFEGPDTSDVVPYFGGEGEIFGPTPPQEPLAGYASEIAGGLAGTGVTALTGNPALGVAAGMAVEYAVESLFQGPVQEPTPGYFGGGSDMNIGGSMAVPQLQFVYVKVNPMTGLKYGRLADGRMVYERKNGTIKLYRPKKPIVLMPGSITLSQAARASTQLGNLAKKLKKSKFKAFM